jgi:hypothetical protein
VAAFTRRIASERLGNDQEGDSTIAVADVDVLATPDKDIHLPGHGKLKDERHPSTEVVDTETKTQHTETVGKFDREHDTQHRTPDEL